MSAQVRERGAVFTLPESAAPDPSINPSMTRWFYNPYHRINNFGSISLARHFGAAERHRYTEFEQGVFYPLRNISWNEPDLEAAAEQSRAGISSGPVPDLKHVKYAYEQAEELASSFGDRGAVILQPGLFPRDLSWVDDEALLQLISDTVQPRELKIYEMVTEFGAPAQERIRKSRDLDTDGQELASAILRLMRQGAVLAQAECQREYELLIQYMGNAATGASPKIATPNDFHVWVCEQLGKPVPSMVNAGIGQQAAAGTDPTLTAAVNLLVQRALRDEDAKPKGRKKKVEEEEVVEAT